jgi:hypothetical protein
LGAQDDGRTWEYLLFLAHVERLRPTVPDRVINSVLGYSDTYVFPERR